MKKTLLDTNAYSNLLKGDTKVLDMLKEADLIWMSVFVVGELLTGFSLGSKRNENKTILKRFLDKPSVDLITATYQTAEIFSELKSKLSIAGTPVPINDVWISAHAIETGSVLVTFDHHFKKVPGLRIWDTL